MFLRIFSRFLLFVHLAVDFIDLLRGKGFPWKNLLRFLIGGDGFLHVFLLVSSRCLFLWRHHTYPSCTWSYFASTFSISGSCGLYSLIGGILSTFGIKFYDIHRFIQRGVIHSITMFYQSDGKLIYPRSFLFSGMVVLKLIFY